MLFLIAGGAVAALLAGGSGASNEEIFLAPADDGGADAFTESVAVAPPTATTTPTTEPQTSGGTKSFFGSTPGLYGGTRDNASCNTAQLVTFLHDNPDKGAAWAGVLGISPAEIPDYVAKLTPVTLRRDTRVTNHGFKNGKATELQSVLQAGTAVLVSPFGEPVVRCTCGNPLTAPKPLSSPTYTGPKWAGFSPTTVVVVQKTEIEINQYTLVDSTTGQTFVRPAGAGGVDRDGPATPGSSTTTTTTTTKPRQITDITGQRTGVDASSTYPGFGADLGVDGNLATSWFSAGASDGPTSEYTWTATATSVFISDIVLSGNSENSNPSFRTGFDYGSMTVQVVDAAGAPVGAAVDADFPHTSPVTVPLGSIGRSVIVTFKARQSPDCGGFGEIAVHGSIA